jgi:3-(3-hydroxy-phenyl)propionate hydroxylase
MHVPVVIIGAGPVGLTAANLLGQAGVKTLVIERNPDTVPHPRAIVLDDEGARTLQAFGADDFLTQTIEGDGARYFDNNGTCFARVGAGPRTYGFAKRHFMYQHEFERHLVRHLKRYPEVELRFAEDVVAVTPEAGGVTIVSETAEQRRLTQCDWLLACDGARSGVRQSLDIAFSGSTYEQEWIVLDMDRDPDKSNFSRFYCSTERPVVSVPAPRGGRRYEFMLQDGDDRTSALSDEMLAKLCAPFRTFRPEDVIRRAIYTFHARIASQFRKGRVLLLGDAAHVTPPFAGQGMNSGLRDAHNVAWKLELVLKGLADESIMDSYEQERRDPAWAMIQLAVAMGQVVMPKGREQVEFRELLLKALEPFPGVQDYFLQMRFKPKPRYGGGLFVDFDAQRYEASLVGEMIPQPNVVGAGGRARKLDDLLGPGFALIAQNESCSNTLKKLSHPIWDELKPARVSLFDGSPPADAPTSAIMPVDPISRPLRTHRDQILLVRPDRYVAGAFHPTEQFAFAKKLAALLKRGDNVRMSA